MILKFRNLFIFLFIYSFIFISCNSQKGGIPVEIKVLSKKESNKIFKDTKEDPKTKVKLRIRKKEEKISIQTNKGKSIKVGTNNYKVLEKNLETKKTNEKEKIKNTLDDLEFMKYKKDIITKVNKNNDFGNSSQNRAKLYLSDEMRAVFKPVVNKYSMRHLKFRNSGEKLQLDSISMRYENKKKKIEVEVMDLTLEPLAVIKRGQKDFFYKSYKLGNISVYLSINYKLKVINGVFNHLGYTWIINGINISDFTDVIDIIRNINFDLFMELKAKYEKE